MKTLGFTICSCGAPDCHRLRMATTLHRCLAGCRTFETIDGVDYCTRCHWYRLLATEYGRGGRRRE